MWSLKLRFLIPLLNFNEGFLLFLLTSFAAAADCCWWLWKVIYGHYVLLCAHKTLWLLLVRVRFVSIVIRFAIQSVKHLVSQSFSPSVSHVQCWIGLFYYQKLKLKKQRHLTSDGYQGFIDFLRFRLFFFFLVVSCWGLVKWLVFDVVITSLYIQRYHGHELEWNKNVVQIYKGMVWVLGWI